MKAPPQALFSLAVYDPYEYFLGDKDEIDSFELTRLRNVVTLIRTQFLKRFVGDIPWVHLDIAGVTWSKKGTDFSRPGGTGFGVRLLDNFIENNYE